VGLNRLGERAGRTGDVGRGGLHEVHAAGRCERHASGRRKRSDARFGRVHRVFYPELGVFALQRGLARQSAPDIGVELEHDQLHRDDPDQREGEQPDPQAPADQAVQQCRGPGQRVSDRPGRARGARRTGGSGGA